MVKTKVLAILVITTFTLSGCTGLTGIVGCGEAYEEMYGGYDYVYDTKTGACLASFGAGAGRCVVRATRIDGDRVLVSAEASPETPPLALPKERSNAIGMRCVELALDEKFGGQ